MQRSAGYHFDADGALFKLAAEALRIRMSAQFDPMAAVNSSDLEPLPHQIQAVYGELLERTPLRFVLADDPGAGKTIMAGLYVKELMLRGDLERCLVVAPGGLVDQWQEELLEKFGLRFEVLTRKLMDAHSHGDGVVHAAPLLIARMDQLSRSPELLHEIVCRDWDLVVVDEAHRMAARYSGDELRKTRRYQLGELLSRYARHLLLMTATPHAGNDEDFQLFMALLDPDRFEGKHRDGITTADTDGLMRRMVKEELLTFDGTPLFPERRAYTVPYRLSPAERELYESVTAYVREQMGRAEALAETGQAQRRTTVGFALTVLQRRLASSPAAILESLQRRRSRLMTTRRELLASGGNRLVPQPSLFTAGFDDDDLDELTGDEIEGLEDAVVDSATAAQTLAELDAELDMLADLIDQARGVRHSGTDRKWFELSELLQSNDLIRDSDGNPRKLIIFTEHKDTLDYLADSIRGLLGRQNAVECIHGGVSRDRRHRIKDIFAQDKDCRVLVATDAAGEGLNLQCAHLMVNYDLPWNPNRIEQRFGRIHRIGQIEVCHLWNLVAEDTREGAVFTRLLDKIEEQRKAYRGKVFDVLGEAFREQPLRTLLTEAVRYGDRPDVRERHNQVIDASVDEGLGRLLDERALAYESLAAADVTEWRHQMDDARARRLQPHFIRAFFLEAFRMLGGRIADREAGRYEVRHVPSDVIHHGRRLQIGTPVLRRYERITFDLNRIRVADAPHAELLAPGHPLLDAVVSLVIDRYGALLGRGSVLADRRDSSEDPRVLVAIAQEIVDGRDIVVGKQFDFVELGSARTRAAAQAAYLDYTPVTDDERIAVALVLEQDWLVPGIDSLALAWAADHGLPAYLDELRTKIAANTARTRKLIRTRLLHAVNYWDQRHAELLDSEKNSKPGKIRSDTAYNRARELEHRLHARMEDLDRATEVHARTPQVAGAALVIPQGLLDTLTGATTAPDYHAVDTMAVAARAVARVMAEERALGRLPEEQPHNNPGYDIRSRTPGGPTVYIEVKARVLGAHTFHITHTEVLYSKNAGTNSRLALVSIHPDGTEHDEVRYITDPFKNMDFGDFAVDGVVGNWSMEWARGGAPF
ncbi:helicase-related protein [Nocardia sp. NPDC052278]|uniref:helicase-related protein n=1 Tax=unclassified Nocardia TaxID=2637762 RepID=UPI0036A1A81F